MIQKADIMRMVLFAEPKAFMGLDFYLIIVKKATSLVDLTVNCTMF